MQSVYLHTCARFAECSGEPATTDHLLRMASAIGGVAVSWLASQLVVRLSNLLVSNIKAALCKLLQYNAASAMQVSRQLQYLTGLANRRG